MTVSSTTRKAGPFSGNSAVTIFPFGFKVFAKTDIKVIVVSPNGSSTSLVLDSDYSVALNVDQNNTPGGAITYPISGEPLQTGYSLVALGDLPLDQETDITNSGGFYPSVIEDMVDRATIQIQQVAELAGRAIVVTEAESTAPVLPPASARSSMILGFDAAGNVTLLPITTPIGAGDLRNDTFVSGTDFVAGTTSALNLSRAPGSVANLLVFFDTNYQDKTQILSLNGVVLTFTGAIPQGVNRVTVISGTTLSIIKPAAGTVDDTTISWGTILERNVDTIAALKALDWTLHARARAAGYLTAGDGGGGSFYKDPADTTSAEDGGNVFIANDGTTRVKRQSAGVNSVRQFGAVGAGTDYTTQFINAATYAPGGQTMHGSDATTIVRADMVDIHVPAGNYTLSSYIGSAGRQINWYLDPGANVTNYGYLLGKIIRQNLRTASLTYGTRDYAVGMAYRVGPIDSDKGAEISGFSQPSDITTYPDRDSVCFYADNTAPPPLLTDGGALAYTATSVTFSFVPTAYQLASLRKGMVIDTMHATKYSGFITSWSANGQTVNVSGWYLSGGSTAAVTPPNGYGALINPVTKIWALNANALVPPTATSTTQSAGFELGLQGGITAAVEPYLGFPRLWGYDSVNLGSTRGSAAFIARGDWWHGYRAEGQVVGFAYKGSNTVIEAQDAIGNDTFSLSSSGSIEMGNFGVAGTRFIDFHTNGDPSADYNVRLSANGGTGGVNGDGNYIVTAASFSTSANLFPVVDNNRSMGLPTNRWNVIYAATGTINTSDAREKQQFTDDLAPELRAWAKVSFGKYKWNHAVDEKGDKARWHFGLIAQHVKDAFESEGLDPFAYGVLCYDEWGDVYEPVMATRTATREVEVPGRLGTVTHTVEYEEEYDTGEKRLVRAAGNRYGVRYEEALALECAYLRSQLTKGN